MIEWRKLKKREEKLRKTQNRINPISQEDIPDNNIILFSTFNILKSNKVEEKDPSSDFQNKSENSRKYKIYKNSMSLIYFNYSQIENEDKKDEKKEQSEEKDNLINT